MLYIYLFVTVSFGIELTDAVSGIMLGRETRLSWNYARCDGQGRSECYLEDAPTATCRLTGVVLTFIHYVR